MMDPVVTFVRMAGLVRMHGCSRITNGLLKPTTGYSFTKWTAGSEYAHQTGCCEVPEKLNGNG